MSDPFIAQDVDYYLWRNSNETQWMWVRKSDRAIVYFQDWRSDLKKALVFYAYENKGIYQNDKVSAYDFQMVKCLK